MSDEKPKVSKQCKTCPWKVGCDPEKDIPRYSAEKHAGLTNTIAEPGSVRGLGRALNVMACHYSTEGDEKPCVGWLMNQLGPGNNIPLRLRASKGDFGRIEVDGPQHKTFEDTLPKKKRRRKS